MPYTQDVIGIYKIVNNATGLCYVGQSQRVKKRIKEHFRLLRGLKHPNAKLQHAFNKYGVSNFSWHLEAVCEDVADLDIIEEAFLTGEAKFIEPTIYNIADFAKAPMRNKTHSEEVRIRISAGRKATTFNYQSEEYRQTMRDANRERHFNDKQFVAKIKYILDNTDMSYAERGRVIGADISSVRKLALRYNYLKGTL
jgi:group I intron endonuclease